MNIVDTYEAILAAFSIGILAYFIKALSKVYDSYLTRNEMIAIGVGALIMAVLLYVVVEPKTKMGKVKVILYGVVTGGMIVLGLIGWGNMWLPEIPMG